MVIIVMKQRNRKFLYAGIVLITVLLFTAASCAHQVDDAQQQVAAAAAEEPAPAPDQAEPEQPMPMPDFEAPAEIDDFEQIRPELEQYLVQQRQNEALMRHISTLRSEADIETFLSDVDFSDENAAAARVNGEVIPVADILLMQQHELQQMHMMGLQPGSSQEQEIISSMRPQILDNLISVLLIEQQAAADGLAATDEEIDEIFQMYIQQFGGEDNLRQQMSMAGITEEELRSDIAYQIPLEKYLESFFEQALTDADLEFSEEELKALYEELVQQQQ